MSADPFLIQGPAVISFSGGRTSGFMLHRILGAHGGALPADVKVVFCNTGKERSETLDFVERCSCEWNVPIVWLEYRYANAPAFAVVDYATASRNGEPFEAALTSRGGESGFLPNPRVRYCTIELKILTTIRWLVSLGWTEWTNAIGFRADEPLRIAKLNAAIRDDREECVAPLAEAGITREKVLAFWNANTFDLQLEPDESNCDLCFLRKRGQIEREMNKRPQSAEWWIRQEARRGTRFRKDRSSYATMFARSQRESLPMMDDEPDELGIACHCTD